ncbi:unnamed protein product [Pleuronectes platessa]|uniref:Uncharacterized protein n=1 Tax=Pleuronectes platessa TaxID=8262 RepID=A0A9N7UG70_PLEPL|nr:unnamed protein product [Pleuronectes platessa]
MTRFESDDLFCHGRPPKVVCGKWPVWPPLAEPTALCSDTLPPPYVHASHQAVGRRQLGSLEGKANSCAGDSWSSHDIPFTKYQGWLRTRWRISREGSIYNLDETPRLRPATGMKRQSSFSRHRYIMSRPTVLGTPGGNVLQQWYALAEILMGSNASSLKEADAALFVRDHTSPRPVKANSCSFAVLSPRAG